MRRHHARWRSGARPPSGSPAPWAWPWPPVGARAPLERPPALIATRPTAVNLRWGVERALAADDPCGRRSPSRPRTRSATGPWAGSGAELLPPGCRVLTHCNTGSLACAEYGTALGVIRSAHESGKDPSVWVDETRPVMQGSRLTAWELARLGIPATVLVDGAAGSVMARGEVDCVVVGADRIAANGDVANKIGTYSLAVLARHHRIPFYVAAPLSTVDLQCRSGADIRSSSGTPTRWRSSASGGWCPPAWRSAIRRSMSPRPGWSPPSSPTPASPPAPTGRRSSACTPRA